MQLVRHPEFLAKNSSDQDWTGTLECVIGSLDRLDQDTEQYFLKIGGRLAGFIDSVDSMSSELDSLVNQVSSKLGQETSSAFTAALDRSREIQGRTEGSGEILVRLHGEAGRLKRILAGFRGTVSTFRSLGLLTRIEGARLGDARAEFGGMASMAVDVRVRVEKALASAALLIPAIETALQNVSALEAGQARELPTVISRVLSSLESFSDIQKRSHDAAVRMVAQYDAISDAFTRLIVSMQFHDITRQQIEHVIDVLRRLCTESDDEHGSDSNRPPVAAVVSLQSSQLADAAQKFARSVASIALSLDEVAANAKQMADQSTQLFGLTQRQSNSFFLEMEQGCNAVVTSLRLCVKAQDAIRMTSDNLSQTISGMRGSIDGIRTIAIQIQQVGMNARIRAANTGHSGAALGALSRSIQQLAFETQQRSEALLEALANMKDAAANLSGRGEAVVGGEASQDSYLDGMRMAVSELHSNERGFAQVAQIVARGTRLREELDENRTSFTVGAPFAEAIQRARDLLAEIAGTSSSGLPADAGALTQALGDFAIHYTMQAERDVHESVTRGAGRATYAAAQAKQSELPPAEAQDLGNDVEFF